MLKQAPIRARSGTILPSRGPVRLASFSPDGSLVLTGSDDGTVRVWRLDGTPVRTLFRGGPVTAAGFSPDGRLVLTGSRTALPPSVGSRPVPRRPAAPRSPVTSGALDDPGGGSW